MADKYENFGKLAEENNDGTDFSITVQSCPNSAILIIAPHAGKIETGTSEIARSIAGIDHSLYLFEGKKSARNGDLHITSHHFDEPQALKILTEHKIALGIHGRKNHAMVTEGGIDDPATVFIGGRNIKLCAQLQERLEECGFKARASGHGFPASDPNNVCNRGTSGEGAQLELPLTLRESLKGDSKQLEKFANAVRAALSSTIPPCALQIGQTE